MGGFGSGRKWGKTCTEDMRGLDVRRMQRDGRLVPGASFNWRWSIRGEVIASIGVAVEADRVVLSYRQRDQGGEWKDVRYPVLIDRTPCNLGGSRLWWRCPAAGCGRRVALLFGGSVFACRYCHQLAYRSQRETADDRAGRRAGKIRDRLGWQAGILNGEGGKPKGILAYVLQAEGRARQARPGCTDRHRATVQAGRVGRSKLPQKLPLIHLIKQDGCRGGAAGFCTFRNTQAEPRFPVRRLARVGHARGYERAAAHVIRVIGKQPRPA